MSSSARRSEAPALQDDDPLLAAIAQAPLVPLTEAEHALLSDVQSRPVRWIPHEQFASMLEPHDKP
jgi:hypothetical protein